MISCYIWQIQNNRYICPLEHKHITMGNFFTSLFSSSKSEDTAEGKAKNDQKNFDILKYDGIRAQKIGQVAYAIKCFTEALNIQEDFETMNHLVSAYSMAN